MSRRTRPRPSHRSRTAPGGVLSSLFALLALLAAACEAPGETEAEPEDEDVAAEDAEPDPDYPERPVEMIVPWAAGGGTDQVARMVAQGLGDELGETVNVVNRTGGGGAVGHSAIATAQPDGHTIGMATVEIAMMHWMGLADVTVDDLAAVGQVNLDPAGVTVRDDAPWETLQDLIDDVEANPGDFTGSGTGRGGIWDLARAGMLLELGMPEDAIVWVPSEGAAPALQELLAGGIDISFASLVENVAMIEEGDVRALAIMAEERDENFEDVPTLSEEGIDWATGAWRGIAAPEGTPPEVLAALEEALQTVVESDEFVEFMDDVGFGIVWRDSAEFAEFMQSENETMGEVMQETGLADLDPEEEEDEVLEEEEEDE